jgi:hypothetical protein
MMIPMFGGNIIRIKCLFSSQKNVSQIPHSFISSFILSSSLWLWALIKESWRIHNLYVAFIFGIIFNCKRWHFIEIVLNAPTDSSSVLKMKEKWCLCSAVQISTVSVIKYNIWWLQFYTENYPKLCRSVAKFTTFGDWPFLQSQIWMKFKFHPPYVVPTP